MRSSIVGSAFLGAGPEFITIDTACPFSILAPGAGLVDIIALTGSVSSFALLILPAFNPS